MSDRKPHLQLVGNSDEPDSSLTQRVEKMGDANLGAGITSALDAIGEADSSEEAFSSLQAWSQCVAALGLPAYDVEQELHRGGMEVLRKLLEENFRSRGVGEVGVALMVMKEDDEEVRLGYRREHDRAYESIFGTIELHRLGYGAPGQSSVHPLDEELNLPRRRYSYVVQKRGVKLSGRGPYDEVLDEIAETTAARLPKRQLEEVAKDGVVDFDPFYEERCSSLPSPDETGPILVASIDCKGVPRRRTPEEKAEPQPVRLGTGEKKIKKKMATVASVHTTPPHMRTAEEVVAQLMDPNPPKRSENKPRPKDRRLWASLHKSKDVIIQEVADEMKRRDPDEKKTAVCVMDGERALRTRAVKHLQGTFAALILILDIIHVLEYLWKASYAFHPPGSEAARLWVRQRLLIILQGGVSRVVAGMRQSATKRRLNATDRKAVDVACRYFINNKDRMKYDEYLAKGLPIASGSAEGACGHLVKDRMELTGALWNVHEAGAEAILKIRALDKSGDLDEYWDFHMQQERKRLYGQEWHAVA